MWNRLFSQQLSSVAPGWAEFSRKMHCAVLGKRQWSSDCNKKQRTSDETMKWEKEFGTQKRVSNIEKRDADTCPQRSKSIQELKIKMKTTVIMNAKALKHRFGNCFIELNFEM